MSDKETEFHGVERYSSFYQSVILDSLLTRRSRVTNCLKYIPILHPLGPVRCMWDFLVMIMLIYTCFELPFTIAFNIHLNFSNSDVLPFAIIAISFDILLLFDVILNFRTAYFDKYDDLRLVTNAKSIAKKYIKGWFFIDFLTSIPLEFVVPPEQSNIASYLKLLRIFRLFRIVKMLRLLKMLKIFDGIMKRFSIRELVIFAKMSRIVAAMLLFAHFAACFWFYVGTSTSANGEESWLDAANINNSTTSLFVKYSYCWYWAMVTIFTTGYGDITATNTTEQWVSGFCILCGSISFAYFVGSLTVLLTEGDRLSGIQGKKIEEAQAFCDYNRLPKMMARAVTTHVRYHCKYNFLFNHREIMQNLPSYLQHDINTLIAHKILSKLRIFKKTPSSILGEIALKMRSISCNEKFKLYSKNDCANEFFIQRTGVSCITYEDSNDDRIMTRGDICGEGALLYNYRRETVECHTWCEFYVLSCNDIQQILKEHYPERWMSKWEKMQNRVRRTEKRALAHGKHAQWSVQFNSENPAIESQEKISVRSTVDTQKDSVPFFEHLSTMMTPPKDIEELKQYSQQLSSNSLKRAKRRQKFKTCSSVSKMNINQQESRPSFSVSSTKPNNSSNGEIEIIFNTEEDDDDSRIISNRTKSPVSISLPSRIKQSIFSRLSSKSGSLIRTPSSILEEQQDKNILQLKSSKFHGPRKEVKKKWAFSKSLQYRSNSVLRNQMVIVHSKKLEKKDKKKKNNDAGVSLATLSFPTDSNSSLFGRSLAYNISDKKYNNKLSTITTTDRNMNDETNEEWISSSFDSSLDDDDEDESNKKVKNLSIIIERRKHKLPNKKNKNEQNIKIDDVEHDDHQYSSTRNTDVNNNNTPISFSISSNISDSKSSTFSSDSASDGNFVLIDDDGNEHKFVGDDDDGGDALLNNRSIMDITPSIEQAIDDGLFVVSRNSNSRENENKEEEDINNIYSNEEQLSITSMSRLNSKELALKTVYENEEDDKVEIEEVEARVGIGIDQTEEEND